MKMKRAALLLLTVVFIMLLSSCGQGSGPAEEKAEEKQEETGSKSTSKEQKEVRIFFDRSSDDDSTYKQHVEALWEETKALLREDIAKDYTDEELKVLGTEIDTAWVNLQIHSSINHMEEINAIEDAKYANITEDIIGLVDELYATRYTGSPERRKERLENLKNGRLEFKIKEFDETLKNAK